MPRARTGSTFIKDGIRQIAVTTDRDTGKPHPKRWIRPVKPGVTEIEARAEALTLQRAYDACAWDPWDEQPATAPATADPPPPAPVTLLAHARDWITTQHYTSAGEDRQRIELYVAPDAIGALALAAITPRDCAAFVARVRALTSSRDRKPLAPRTVRNIVDVVRRALAAAVVAGALEASPWRLPRGALPALTDKRAEFRAAAVFTREEAIALCTDPQIPPDRRVLYALLVLTGCRFGEVAALRWRHYDAARRPLGRLTVSVSIERRSRAEKGVKSGVAREVPAHPALAAILKAWRGAGWRAMLEREPGPDDFVIPSRMGGARGERQAHARLQEDLVRLGFRGRRVHDLRRTFVSLCRDDGARGDVLRWVSHGGSRASMVDLYSTLAWSTLCTEVARLRFDLPSQPTPPMDALREALRSGRRRLNPQRTPAEAAGFEPVQSDANRNGTQGIVPPATPDGLPQSADGGRSATGSATPVARLLAAWSAGALWRDDDPALLEVPS